MASNRVIIEHEQHEAGKVAPSQWRQEGDPMIYFRGLISENQRGSVLIDVLE